MSSPTGKQRTGCLCSPVGGKAAGEVHMEGLDATGMSVCSHGRQVARVAPCPVQRVRRAGNKMAKSAALLQASPMQAHSRSGRLKDARCSGANIHMLLGSHAGRPQIVQALCGSAGAGAIGSSGHSMAHGCMHARRYPWAAGGGGGHAEPAHGSMPGTWHQQGNGSGPGCMATRTAQHHSNRLEHKNTCLYAT